MSGLFIVFEGGDGTGKTTQVRLLAERFKMLGVEPLITREPGGTELGTKLRQLLLDKETGYVDSRAESLLYAADKAHHVDTVIRPALQAGRVVICDRYTDSMLAYQGAGRSLGLEELKVISDWATYGVAPDLTVLLDIDPVEALGRIADKDRLEGAGLDFHNRTRELFLELARKDQKTHLVLPALTLRQGNANKVWAKLIELGLVDEASSHLTQLPEKEEHR